MPNDSSDFNLIHDVLEIDDVIESFQKAYYYFENYDPSLDMIIDNFSVTKIDYKCDGDLLRNGDLAIGDSRFYTTYGYQMINVIDFPHATWGKALKMHSRSHESHGVAQYLHIDTDCLEVFDRIRIFVRYQIHDSNGNAKQCGTIDNGVTIKCLYMRARGYSDFGDAHPWITGPVVFSEDKDGSDWAWLTGIYKLGTVEANHSALFVHVGGPQMEYDIILDKMEFEVLPIQCSQLFLNPSFDGSSSYWMDNGGQVAMIKNGSDDAVLFQHVHPWQVLYQEVDSRCFVSGQTFILKAEFKLLDANNLSQSLSCRTDEFK